jgi:hypothetical protein
MTTPEWKWSPDISLISSMVRLGQLTTQRSWRRPKQVNLGSLLLTNLTVHGTYFELTIGILPSRTKGQDVASLKKYLPPPINRGGFHGLSMKKIGSKVGQKSGFSPYFFSSSRHLSLLSLYVASSTTTTSKPLWETTTQPSPLTYPLVGDKWLTLILGKIRASPSKKKKIRPIRPKSSQPFWGRCDPTRLGSS